MFLSLSRTRTMGATGTRCSMASVRLHAGIGILELQLLFRVDFQRRLLVQSRTHMNTQSSILYGCI